MHFLLSGRGGRRPLRVDRARRHERAEIRRGRAGRRAPRARCVRGGSPTAGLEVALVEQHLVGRRVLVLRLHAVEGAAAPGRAARRGEAHPRRARGGDRRPRRGGGARAARRDHPRPRRLRAGRPGSRTAGSTLVRGHGRLDGERRVRVGDDALVARRAVVVATGSGAAVPPIDGLPRRAVDEPRGHDGAARCRARLTILGGGVVGVEMAQAWRSLGAQVTLDRGGDRAPRARGAVRQRAGRAALAERGRGHAASG